MKKLKIAVLMLVLIMSAGLLAACSGIPTKGEYELNKAYWADAYNDAAEGEAEHWVFGSHQITTRFAEEGSLKIDGKKLYLTIGGYEAEYTHKAPSSEAKQNDSLLKAIQDAQILTSGSDDRILGYIFMSKEFVSADNFDMQDCITIVFTGPELRATFSGRTFHYLTYNFLV